MTRTSTELPRLEPESSASTNSAMTAFMKSKLYKQCWFFARKMRGHFISRGLHQIQRTFFPALEHDLVPIPESLLKLTYIIG